MLLADCNTFKLLQSVFIFFGFIPKNKLFVKNKDVLMQCKHTFVECKDVYVECKDVFVECKLTLVQCQIVFVKCKVTLIQCQNVFVKCNHTLIICKDVFVKCKLLLNKRCIVDLFAGLSNKQNYKVRLLNGFCSHVF